MGLLSHIQSALFGAGTQSLIARYQRFRAVQLPLNNTLVGRLSRGVLMEGARRLGMAEGNTLVFNSEDESSVLMDYCIYDVFCDQRNAVDEYLSECPDPGSEEEECLRAMQRATYSLLVVLDAEPGVGCRVRDLFADEERLLIDMGLAATCKPGLVLATRVLNFGEYITTGGAVLPLALLDAEQAEEWIAKVSSGADADFDPAIFIRRALEGGGSQRIAYADAHDYGRPTWTTPPVSREADSQRRRTRERLEGSKAAQNRRCRCGSGKMFKNCCGRSRK